MEADPPPAPLALAHYPSIPQLVVPAANLQAYDRLLERK
jgi:hypothetical protein